MDRIRIELAPQLPAFQIWLMHEASATVLDADQVVTLRCETSETSEPANGHRMFVETIEL